MCALKRLSRQIQQDPQFAGVLLLGVILVLAGGIIAARGMPNPGTGLSSVGCSMIAAALVSLLSPSADEVYRKFKQIGITDLYPSRDDVIKSQWVRWLRLARHQFVEIGITNSGWLGDPSFLPVLKDRLQNDVDVKIFFLDPTCHAAETRALEDSPRPTIATIQKSIQVLWEFRNGLSSPIQQRLHVFVYTCTPSSGTT